MILRHSILFIILELALVPQALALRVTGHQNRNLVTISGSSIQTQLINSTELDAAALISMVAHDPHRAECNCNATSREMLLSRSSRHTMQIRGVSYNISTGYCADRCGTNIDVNHTDPSEHSSFMDCERQCSEAENCTAFEFEYSGICSIHFSRSLYLGMVEPRNILCMVKNRKEEVLNPADCITESTTAAPCDCSTTEAVSTTPAATKADSSGDSGGGGASGGGDGGGASTTEAATTDAPTTESTTPAPHAYLIADAGNYRILKWEVGASSGKVVAGGNGRGDGLNQFNYPHMVLLTAKKDIVVSDTYNHRVVVWSEGATEGVVAAGGNGKGNRFDQLANPKGIAIDGDGNLFVADSSNHRVMKWPLKRIKNNTKGVLVAGGNGLGSETKNIKPYSVAVGKNRDLFVMDTHMHRLMKWKRGRHAGEVLVGHGKGENLNQLNSAINFAVDNHDNFIIADYFNHRVVKWAKGANQGVLVAGGNGKGSDIDQLMYPSSVSIDANGDYLVTDTDNNRIMSWAKHATQGVLVAGGMGEGPGLHQLAYPKSVVAIS